MTRDPDNHDRVLATDRTLSTGRRPVEEYVELAEVNLEDGEWEAAMINLKQAIKKMDGRDKRKMQFFATIACEGLGRVSSAQQKLEEIERSPQWLSIELDVIKAATIREIQADSTEPWPHCVLGACARQREDWVAARREYLEAQRLGRHHTRWATVSCQNYMSATLR